MIVGPGQGGDNPQLLLLLDAIRVPRIGQGARAPETSSNAPSPASSSSVPWPPVRQTRRLLPANLLLVSAVLWLR